MEILDNLWVSRQPDHVLFLEIIEGYIIKETDIYPDSIFYKKDDKVLIVYNKKTKHAFVDFYLLFNVFRNKFAKTYSNDHQETVDILITIMKRHLNIEVINVYKNFFIF